MSHYDTQSYSVTPWLLESAQAICSQVTPIPFVSHCDADDCAEWYLPPSQILKEAEGCQTAEENVFHQTPEQR